jgi:predicted RNase H-like HicB family nuclease
MESVMRYTAIIEQTGTGYSGYLPDVPGCVATGRTAAETRRNLEQALRFHAEGLAEDGLELPPPRANAMSVSTIETGGSGGHGQPLAAV